MAIYISYNVQLFNGLVKSQNFYERWFWLLIKVFVSVLKLKSGKNFVRTYKSLEYFCNFAILNNFWKHLII